MAQAREFFRSLTLPPYVRTVILNAISIGVVVVLLLFLVGTLWRVWFNNPPVRMRGLDPVNLGVLCPEQKVPIHVTITISEPIIVHYYVSVLDSQGNQNMVGTPRAFTDMLHPRAATFEAEFPWTVPVLPPGRYRRVMAVRNIAGSQNTVFVERFFEIGDTCPTPPIPR